MFCHQCGKELRENTRFCSDCGALIQEISGQDDSAGTKEPDPQAADLSSNTPEPASQDTPGAELPADLVLKNGSVTVTGGKLYLNSKHYIRRPGRKKFRKEKNPSTLSLDLILAASIEHHKYGGQIFLTLLLFLCFTAGLLFSVRHGYDAYKESDVPYRNEELAALENVMSVIANGEGQLLQYQNALKENRAGAESLSAKLSELKAQQTQEILSAVYHSDRFDLDAFFNRDLFSHAYQDYLQDLLHAFKADESLNSWLYSYYETTKEYGGNDFLDTDLWIYHGSGGSKFSSTLDSAASLMSEQYDLDLYEHILYTGRIYITGADFLEKVLLLPRYTVDGAVFAKAFNGVPNAAELYVPGWSSSRYEEFWLYGVTYYTIDTPMWLDHGFQAADLNLDWNTLIDETAFYKAYTDFMDKIAPGLPRYEMAVYHADDAAYGGMGCDIKGSEASFSDIVTIYAETHPAFIDELRRDQNYSSLLTTSVDGRISSVETRLERLEKEFLFLQGRERDLTQILADADIYRSRYLSLLDDIEQHTRQFTSILMFFSGTAFLCVFAALFCLCQLFGFLKRPRHLFIIYTQNREYAFRVWHYPEEQIAALQERLSPGPPESWSGTTATDGKCEKIF